LNSQQFFFIAPPEKIFQDFNVSPQLNQDFKSRNYQIRIKLYGLDFKVAGGRYLWRMSQISSPKQRKPISGTDPGSAIAPLASIAVKYYE
jgi:hypothetical protein